MHPVSGRMGTLCAEKVATKKLVFKRPFFTAHDFPSEKRA